MVLTNEQKILIFVAILLVVGYFIYNNNNSQSNKTIEKLEGNMGPSTDSDNVSVDSTSSSMTSSSGASSDASSVASSVSSASSESVALPVATSNATGDITIRRGKNANTSNEPKQVSFRDGRRGGAGDLDRFFMNGNAENAAENSEFGPADYVSGKLAAYTAKKTDEGLLPVEEKDWFEDVTPTKIKNRHLINIYRPVGVNTVSTSLKNPSLDIRGSPANPKTVVSPFLNSSIEPDHNIRGLCV
jgi:cytoskeletal protein RodZ